MWQWYAGGIVLLTWIVLFVRAIPGLVLSVALTPRQFKRQSASSIDSFSENHVPRVSVLVAARNEARSLPRTLRSLQNQTWPNLEVIAVDDRSTDNTGAVIDKISAVWSKLRGVHITELPDGWLGKNYALHTASSYATGEWFLFTDADVVFHPDAVTSAMYHVLGTRSIEDTQGPQDVQSAAPQPTSHPGTFESDDVLCQHAQPPHQAELDHLTLAPHIVAEGFWLSAAVYLFLFNVIMVFRPQYADKPKSPAFVGIGAFNLIRRSVYTSIGGHKSVALRPDDDLAIGAVIKRSHFRQKFAGGTDLLTVEWYPSLRAMAHGLEKNSLAPFQYRLWKFALGILAFLLVYLGPAVGTLLACGLPRTMFGLAFLLQILAFHLTRRYSGVSTWWAFTLPIATPILFYMLVRSAVLCLVRGGIDWRGTFYNLRDLRHGSPKV